MKKYIGIFLLTSMFTLTSCDESLIDQFTPGALTEEVAITTSADLSKLMNTAYAYLTPSSEIEFNSVFTDEVGIGYANGGQGLNDNFAFLLNSSSDSPDGIWASNYFTLSMVNRVIKYADQVVPVDAVDQLYINRLKAEAYTVRAHCHLQLLAYFSTNPKDMNALGIVLSNDVFPTSYNGLRVANNQVYSLIDADLTAAESLYSTVTESANPIYANKNFTKALKARAAALRGDYPNALIYANDVIANSGLSLATYNNYTTVFHTDSNANALEVIFKLDKNVGQTRTGAIWASVNSTVNGSPFYEMGRSLFNEMNTTNYANAATVQVTGITGNNITIPGNTLAVGDMFVSPVSVPTGASTSNGITTSPFGSLLAGKVYFVKSVIGDVITLTDTANGTSTITLSGASIANNPASFPLTVKTNYGDIRYATNVHPSSIIDYNYATSSDFRNTDKLSIRKYPGTSSNGNLVNDVKICRLSEMYMIKAEAQIAAQDLLDAAITLKVVRDARANRAVPLQVFANATDAWKAVLDERRIEFAYEGYRFIDLKRLGVLANEQILRDPADCAINGACSLSTTDYRFALPIPLSESNPNPGILSQQNPGY